MLQNSIIIFIAVAICILIGYVLGRHLHSPDMDSLNKALDEAEKEYYLRISQY